MLQDAQLTFSSAQAVTSAAGSTNTLDLGVANRDIGTGQPLYVVVAIVTALTEGGSNTSLAIALEGDSTTTISPDGTENVMTITNTAANYAAGAVHIGVIRPGHPALAFQYIRLKYTPAGADLTGGTITAFLAVSIQKWSAKADSITIS